jgi:hypothetical protein
MVVITKTTRIGDVLNTTTNPVDVSASPAPATGQALIATSATTATWQALGAGTQQFVWELIPTGTTVIIPVNQVMQLINRTLTVDGTLVIDGAYDNIVV